MQLVLDQSPRSTTPRDRPVVTCPSFTCLMATAVIRVYSYLPTPSSMWLGSQCDYRGPRCPSPVSVCSNPGTIPLSPWDNFPFIENHPEWLILLIYACHLPWIYHMHLIVKNWLSYQRNWILRLMNYCFTVVICTNITSVSLLTRVQSFELSVV